MLDQSSFLSSLENDNPSELTNNLVLSPSVFLVFFGPFLLYGWIFKKLHSSHLNMRVPIATETVHNEIHGNYSFLMN